MSRDGDMIRQMYLTPLVLRGNQLAIDNITTVPEPATLLLLGLGGMVLRRNRRLS
jgi:hypothetical protein